MADIPNSSERSSEKFTKPRDIALLMGKIHPDRMRAQTSDDAADKVNTSIKQGSAEDWGMQLMKILSGLQATGQMDDWQPDLRSEIVARRAAEVRFVRKIAEGVPEVSEPVRLPRTPRPFLYALDAYTSGASWESVLEIIGSQKESVTRHQIEAFEQEAVDARTYDEVGKVAQKVQSAFGEGITRKSMMGFLTAVLGNLVKQNAGQCKNLSDLEHVRSDLSEFFKSDTGKLFRQVTVMDRLDNRALELGRDLLSAAVTQEQVSSAMAEIRAHPFEFAFVYEQPFSESRDDAIAKIDLLAKLRAKRTEQGLDDLRREVEAYKFHSAEMASKYREQIFGFIERKREVYWPKRPREFMPKP